MVSAQRTWLLCFRRSLFGAAVLMAAVAAPREGNAATITYLINFGDSTYTSDGTNTWNAPPVTFFENVTTSGNEISLLDTSSSDNGLDLAVTFRGATQAGWINYTANSQATWPSLSWFNSTVAAQRAYLNMWNGASETWVISGFDPSDTINIQWIQQHHQTTNTRLVTSNIQGITSNVIGGDAVSSLNYETRAGVNDATWLEWNTSPDISGNLEFTLSGSGAFGSWGNAMRIVVTTQEQAEAVIPEPSTLALAGLGLLGLGLVALRRRRG